MWAESASGACGPTDSALRSRDRSSPTGERREQRRRRVAPISTSPAATCEHRAGASCCFRRVLDSLRPSQSPLAVSSSLVRPAAPPAPVSIHPATDGSIRRVPSSCCFRLRNNQSTQVEGASTTKKRKTSYSNSNREDLSPVVDDGMHMVNNFEESFGDLDDCNEEYNKVNLVALRISQSIVSLASFKGRTKLFACTGTIMEYGPAKMSILTSASLVRCTKDENKTDEKLKIKVRLPNGKLTKGKLWNYDLYYNIAVVKIKYFPELSTAQIHNQGQPNVKLSQSKLVAVGRGFESGELMATGGTLLYKPSKLDCKELMTSTCKITKAGIGGPLVGFDGNFVGMNFCDKKDTPFLPINIIRKCLKHFDMFGYESCSAMAWPEDWILKHEKLDIREQIHGSFSNTDGIYVKEVFDGSPAADSGINVGDVITKLDGVDLFHAQEFYELILGKSEDILRRDEEMLFKVSILRPSNGVTFGVIVNADVVDMSRKNRWPVPKAEWLYPCTDDRCDEIAVPDPIVIRTCEDSYYLPALDESELRLYYGEE
uniref:PDZ domain-containing protein n=1 Tax=Oryza barthii TaxID=65489 RepID=A0A0D3H789_9ORYZ